MAEETGTSLATTAINTAQTARLAYCKFLSANDSGATGAHQSGILISNKAWQLVFPDERRDEPIKKRTVNVQWQGGELTTQSTMTWYQSKHELRLTRFGRGFELLRPEYTGALFVLCQLDYDDYAAYILDGDDDVDLFLDTFGIGPQETNDIINTSGVHRSDEDMEAIAIAQYVSSLCLADGGAFPPSAEVSATARSIHDQVHCDRDLLTINPDRKLVEYTRVEYDIFCSLEVGAFGKRVKAGFSQLDEFLALALSLLNRRKSRAGHSFENQLAAVFTANDLPFEEQVRTEGNKRPDFVFPSGAAYHDLSVSPDNIVVLAAKTTCKDRWRQILSEANRMKKQPKYLVTMQQGNSPQQLAEMRADNVQLVVPQQYISCYPAEYRNDIWSLRTFISRTREAIK